MSNPYKSTTDIRRDGHDGCGCLLLVCFIGSIIYALLG